MIWATLLHEPKAVDGAGRQLAGLQFPVSDNSVLGVINNWRSSHSYPLNTFQTTLRNKARKFETTIIVAQRIKRLESIHSKLSRQRSMRLTQMQDIAGCRVVFANLDNVFKLVDAYKHSNFGHKLRGEKDYINNPKSDGYRCFHLVYEYVGSIYTRHYNTLKIEIQIRSQLQHAWATAVEAVGIFTRQALKSNRGDHEWLRFFALISSIIARLEGTAIIPNTPLSKAALLSELRSLAAKLQVREMLSVYSSTLRLAGNSKGAKYFLLTLEPDTGRITVRRYRASDSQRANQDYINVESAIPERSSTQTVLVSVDSIAALRRAYPNYFLDTAAFNGLVQRALGGNFPNF